MSLIFRFHNKDIIFLFYRNSIKGDERYKFIDFIGIIRFISIWRKKYYF